MRLQGIADGRPAARVRRHRSGMETGVVRRFRGQCRGREGTWLPSAIRLGEGAPSFRLSARLKLLMYLSSTGTLVYEKVKDRAGGCVHIAPCREYGCVCLLHCTASMRVFEARKTRPGVGDVLQCLSTPPYDVSCSQKHT